MKIIAAPLLFVCLASTMVAATPVASYSFSEGVGSTVADSSGNGNTGTITNAVWTASGKYGGALVFNGSSALITIPDAATLHLTTAMTLEAWVNLTSVTSAWRDVIYKGNDNYYLSATSSSSSKPGGGGTFGSTGANVFSTSALTTNVWVYLALTYDGANLRLYVNGTQVSSRAQAGNIATSANPLQIGGDSIYGQYFSGTIDEVRVYNVALTAAQIQTDMNTALANPGASLSPASLSFGSVVVGATSNIQAVTLTNTGSALLAIGSISIVGQNPSDFSQSNVCGSSLAVGASCMIDVTFSPQALNARSATLSASDNAPGSPHVVALSGTGIGSQCSTQPHSAALTWTSSTTGDVTQYNIYRCAGNCQPNTLLASVGASITSYTDASVSSGVTYSYAATAVDPNGESAQSNVAVATIP